MSWLVPAVEIQCLCPVSKILFHFFHAPRHLVRAEDPRYGAQGSLPLRVVRAPRDNQTQDVKTVYLLNFYSLRKRHGIRNVGGLLLVVNCPHLPTVIRGGYKGIGSSALACNRSSSHGFFKTMEAEQRLGCTDTRAL